MRRSNDSNPNTSDLQEQYDQIQSGIHFTNTFHKHRPTSLWKQTPITHKTISNKLKYSNDYNTNPQCLKTPPVGEMPPWAPGPYHWLPHRQSATMELGKWPREKVPGRGVVHLQQFGLKAQQVGELLTPYALLRLMKYTYIYICILYEVWTRINPLSVAGAVLLRDSWRNHIDPRNQCVLFSAYEERKFILPVLVGNTFFTIFLCKNFPPRKLAEFVPPSLQSFFKTSTKVPPNLYLAWVGFHHPKTSQGGWKVAPYFFCDLRV